MRLLVLLICWLLRRRLDLAEVLSPDVLWHDLLQHAPGSGSGFRRYAPVIVASLYAMLVILIAVTSLLLGSAWGISATGALTLGLFVATTGMPGWRKPLVAYAQAWQQGDISLAWREVRDLLPARERVQATTPASLHLLLAETLIVQTFERYFLPLFWLVVLGPVGVVLATFAIGLRNHYPRADVRELFARWCPVLAWIPAQLLSLTFGLAGDLSGWLQYRRAKQGGDKHYGLTRAASGALSSYALDPAAFEQHHPKAWSEFGARSLEAVRDLLNRSMWVWISMVALAAIVGLVP